MFCRLIAIASLAAFIGGCNTMHGAGEDIKAGGNKVKSIFSKDKSSADTPSATPAPSTPDTTTSGTDADRTRVTPDSSMSAPPTDTRTR